MAEKRDLLRPEKNSPGDEKEQGMPEDIEEKNKFSKILQNKKIMIPVYSVLLVAGVAFLFTPGREKGETAKPKEKVQTSEGIDVERLESRKTEEDTENQEQQNNRNNQGYFAYDDSNLQSQDLSENTPNLELSNNQSGYTYGEYPSYYGMDEAGDNSSGGQRKTATEKAKNSPIAFARGSNQSNTETQGAEKEGEQPQGQTSNVQKKTFQLSSGLTAPTSPYEIKTGELIPAILTTAIDSDLSGNVTALVSQDVYDSVRGRYLLIPKGSKLFGTYDSNIIYGQNRLMLIWQRIILPNGYSINLETMQGIDMTGQAGVKGKVNNHTLKLLRSIVLSSLFNFVSSGIGVTVNKNVGNSGDTTVSAGATIGNDIATDTSQKVANAGDMIIERDLSQQPTIRIKAGTKFSIMVNNDMILYPYERLKGSNR